MFSSQVLDATPPLPPLIFSPIFISFVKPTFFVIPHFILLSSLVTSLYLAYKKYCICSYHVDHNDPKTLNKHILQYLWHQIKIRVASPSTFTARKMSFTNRLFLPVFIFLSDSVGHPPSPFHSRKPNIFTPKTIPRKRGRILPPPPPKPSGHTS